MDQLAVHCSVVKCSTAAVARCLHRQGSAARRNSIYRSPAKDGSQERHTEQCTYDPLWNKYKIFITMQRLEFAKLLVKGCFAKKIPLYSVNSFVSAESLWEGTVMEISIVIIPGDYMLMYSRLFVGENCIVVISVSPELGDATWQTSSSALRCPPRIYIFITTWEGHQSDITARAHADKTPSTWKI